MANAIKIYQVIGQAGSTLSEVLVALAILALVFLGVDHLILRSQALSVQTLKRAQAYAFAKNYMACLQVADRGASSVKVDAIQAAFKKQFPNSQLHIIQDRLWITLKMTLPHQRSLELKSPRV